MVVTSQIIPSQSNSHFKIAHLQLNVPKALNALNLEMIQIAKRTLQEWEKDPTIACVFFDGAGDKAFCAGGDVAKLYHLIVAAKAKGENPARACRPFFEGEYDLDYYLHRYPKPIVLWGDGYVMGGGIGLMNGASHRIVTEQSVLAMPEINIGLYPDVGASYFLSRMPGKIGTFLGMTAARIRGEDALHVGLADFYLQRSQKEALLQKLLHTNFTGANNEDLITTAIRSLASPAPASDLMAQKNTIDRLMEGDAQTIVKNFLAQSFAADNKLMLVAQDNLRRGSPTSAAVSHEMIRRSQGISLEAAFAQELDLSLQFCTRNDFPEGVRSLLIDKDKSPRWSPERVEAVNPDWVNQHFAPIPD